MTDLEKSLMERFHVHGTNLAKLSQNTSLCEYHTSEKQNLWSSGILPRQKIAGKKLY